MVATWLWLGAAGLAYGQARMAAGAADIAGTVVTTSPAAPVARALVTIRGEAIATGRTVLSDEHGRFVFRGVPAGSVTIVASRQPFVTMAYGATRPGRSGTPIAVAAGDHLDGLTITLPRGAVITGLVRQAGGEPAPGIDIDVRAIGQPPDPLTPRVVTDDRGVFRAFGLSPGRYAVIAAPRDAARGALTPLTDEEVDERLNRLRQRSSAPAPGAPAPARPAAAARADAPAYRYAPVYYPGTVDPEQAVTVEVAEGETRAGVDITLQLARVLSIEGTVAAPPGVSLANARVTAGRRPSANVVDASAGVSMAAAIDANGRFSFANMLPGTYRLTTIRTTLVPGPASTAGQTFTVSDMYWAMADVSLRDQDVDGVAMTLQPGLKLSGRFVVDATSGATPGDIAAIRLRLVETAGGLSPMPVPVTRADGSFEVDGILPGTYRLEAQNLPAGWRLASAFVNGRDALDFPLEMGTGNIGNAVVTLTDRHSAIAGMLQTTARTPAPGYFIVVFAADRAFWHPASRRVQFTRPGTDGRFTFHDLPAGDYRIAALTDVDAADLADVSFIEALVPASLPVTVHDGETTTQDLRLR